MSKDVKPQIFTLDVNKVGKGEGRPLGRQLVGAAFGADHPEQPEQLEPDPADAAAGAQAYPEPMRLLRSSRFRRRAGWLAVCLAVAGGVAFVGIRFSNTGHAEKQVFEPGKPQLVPKAPKADTFTPAEQRQVRAVAVRFVAERGLPQARRRLVRAHDQRAASGAVPRRTGRPARSRSSPTRRTPWTRSAGASTTPTRTRSVSRSPSTRRPGRASIGRSSTSRSRTTARPTRPHWLVSYWAPEGGVQLSRGDPRAPVGRHGSAEAGARSGLAVRAGRPDRRRSGRRDRFVAIRGRLRQRRAVQAARLYRSSSSPS